MADIDVVVAKLPVHTGGEVIGWADVDQADLARLEALGPWHFHRATGYMRAKSIYLHRAVMQCRPGDGVVVDHVDRNKWNNRNENLRAVTTLQNLQNRKARLDSTTGLRGVLKMSGNRAKPYLARVQVAGTIHNLGYHSTPEAAALAAADGRRLLMTHASECVG